MRGSLHSIRIGVLALLVGCGPTFIQGQSSVLLSHDLSRDGGSQVRLAKGLDEVSGLALTPEGRLFAHNDERAVIYELDVESGRVLKAWTAGFDGVPGDFEGIALVGSRFFLSTSTGEILETGEGSPGSAMEFRLHRTGLGEKCELEGLTFDPEANTLLLPCKEARGRELRDHIVVYSVDVATMTAALVPRIFLPLGELESVGLKAPFLPSGIEIDPQTGNILLISAHDEAILEFSDQGSLRGGRKLRKETHPQAEGIAIGLDGTLIIADEGQGKRGTLTRYPRRGPGEDFPR